MIHSNTQYRIIQTIELKTVHAIAIALFLMYATVSQAQYTIIGSITDSLGLPVNGAVVLCSDAAGHIFSHDVSNTEGRYQVTTDQRVAVELSVTHLSYKDVYAQVEITGAETTWDFVLKESNTLLDEITIKADYLKKDTVEFSMANLNLKEADNLKKILEKIPNFLVGEDGVILYEGKAINKILVNNQVAFINQNTTALNSIQAGMIDNLDVIHNHQNVFEINFDEVYETVINIDTKQSVRNIYSGLLAAEYGTSNTYDISADLMKFSKGLSIIATHNTNSIGKKEMDQNEVQSLFRPETTFSHYQENLLRNLFEEREDFTSNLFSHSTTTLRRRSKRLKLDATAYGLHHSMSQSNLFDIQDINQQFSSTNTSIEDKSGNSFLGHASIAYKLNPKSILAYDIYGNKLKGSDNATVVADQYLTASDTTERNNLFGTQDIHSTLIDQSMSYHNKISHRTIVFAKGRLSNESSLYEGTNSVNNISYMEGNGFRYKNHRTQYDLGIKSKFARYLISSLSANYSDESEEIDIASRDENLVRSKTRSEVNWNTWGDLHRKLDYEVSLSLLSENHILSDGEPLSFLYAPVFLKFGYEKRKHTWLIQIEKNFRSNKLEHSLNIMEPLQYNNGSIDNIMKLSIAENHFAQYSYNDIFEGESLSLRIFWNRYQNDNALFFIENVNGISNFSWFNYAESSNIGFRANASKIILPLKFPTKIDVKLHYKEATLPLNEAINTDRKHYDVSFSLKTLSDKRLNYGLKSQFARLNDRNQFTEQSYTFLANHFSVSYYDKKWDCSLHLLQENHWINDSLRNRWNINTRLTYLIGKYTISLDVRHLGELLSFIDNDTYNYTYSQDGGLVYRSQRDQSLKYILLGLKYIF